MRFPACCCDVMAYLQEGVCDSVTNGACLTGDPAALDIHFGIKIPHRMGNLERLEDDHPGGFAAKIILQRLLVDHDAAFALFQVNPGHGCLPSPGRVEYLLCHANDSYALSTKGCGFCASCGCSDPA